MRKTAIIITDKNNREMMFAINFLIDKNPHVKIISASTLIDIDAVHRIAFSGPKQNYLSGKFGMIIRMLIRSPNTLMRKIKLIGIYQNKGILKIIFHIILYYLRDVLRLGLTYDFYIKNIVPSFKMENFSISDFDKVIYCPSTLDDMGEMILKQFLLKNVSIYCWIYSWDNIYKTNQVLKSADKFIVWNQILKSDLSDLYKIIPEKIEICSPLQFRYISDFNKIKKISRPKKQVMYICCGGVEDKVIDINAINEISLILDSIDKDFKLLVRLYPNVIYTEDEKNQIQLIGNVNIFDSTILPQIKPYMDVKLMQIHESKIIINIGSTFILEAAHISNEIIQMAYLPNFKGVSKKYKNILKYEHINKMLNVEDNSFLVKNRRELTAAILKKLKYNVYKESNENSIFFLKNITNQLQEQEFGDRFLQIVIE